MTLKTCKIQYEIAKERGDEEAMKGWADKMKQHEIQKEVNKRILEIQRKKQLQDLGLSEEDFKPKVEKAKK